MRFAELRERLGADDPGRLNYHLNQLDASFLSCTEDGYELRESGGRIVRRLLSSTAIEEAEVEPLTVDESCSY